MLRTLVALILAAAAATAAPPSKCSSLDIPVQWTIKQMYVDNTPSAIQGDGAPYVNGQGVDALINVCSGSYDATLQLSGTSRSITLSFAKLLAANSYTPTWARNGATINMTFLNVRNILFVPEGTTRAQEYTFTTRLGSSSTSGNFGMLNPSPDAPNNSGIAPNVPIANSPYTNSLVVVHHCPAATDTPTCPKTVTETWHVYPDASVMGSGAAYPVTQVGALLIDVKRLGTTNAGEFSMPFYFVISALN